MPSKLLRETNTDCGGLMNVCSVNSVKKKKNSDNEKETRAFPRVCLCKQDVFFSLACFICLFYCNVEQLCFLLSLVCSCYAYSVFLFTVDTSSRHQEHIRFVLKGIAFV